MSEDIYIHVEEVGTVEVVEVQIPGVRGKPGTSNGIAPTTVADASYTLELADAGGYLRFTNAGAVLVTIPPDVDVSFPLGSKIDLCQAGAGLVTLAAGVGVTLNSRGGALASGGQFAVFAVKNVDVDEWDVIGDLS